ncbi:outer membrane protein assembly factor BamB [Legionella sp. W05-934-2]|jgi:outer membrane protein assembly factor BamB|uniref:outer membrane protein assembly factor BamB n=1 Tax=Legionella sp. W05-934-2 TaxID=1198649 RepID=UPI0034628300
MMKLLYRKITLASLIIPLTSCTYVDNYMLGKDNTPEPKTLPMMTQRSDLTKKWEVPIGKEKNISTLEKTTPVVNKKIIYAVSGQGVVKAIQEGNGKILWQSNLSQPIVSGPTVSDNFIALTTNDAKLHLLKKSDGSKLWQTQLSNDMLAKPLIAKNKVIAKTVDGFLYAFDVKNGEKLWSVDHGAPDIILKASSSPVLANNQYVLSAFSDGKVEAIDIATGRSLWQGRIAFPKGASDIEQLVDVDADPIIENDTAYFAAFQGAVGALSLQTGQFKWRRNASVYKDIAVDRSNLYYVDSNDVIWSLDKQSGRVNWKQPQLMHRGLSAPVVANNQLFVTDKTGLVHGLSLRTGVFTARVNAQAKSSVAPVVADDSLLIQTTSGYLSRYSVG